MRNNAGEVSSARIFDVSFLHSATRLGSVLRRHQTDPSAGMQARVVRPTVSHSSSLFSPLYQHSELFAVAAAAQRFSR